MLAFGFLLFLVGISLLALFALFFSGERIGFIKSRSRIFALKFLDQFFEVLILLLQSRNQLSRNFESQVLGFEKVVMWFFIGHPRKITGSEKSANTDFTAWTPTQQSIPDQDWMQLIHHEDYGRVTALLETHLCGKSEKFETQLRMRGQDGNYRWMLCRGLAVHNEAGVPKRIAGSLTDITVGKVAEGIETADQLAALKALGCQMGKGFLFSTPEPNEKAKQLVQQNWQYYGRVSPQSVTPASTPRSR